MTKASLGLGFLATALLAGAASSGCRATRGSDDAPPGASAVDAIRSATIRRAILAQRALFPYHFVEGGADLNALGLRDLEVLAEHFLANPGTLAVRRGEASDVLYGARVTKVVEALAAAGVEAGRVSIADSPPGGDGMASDRVVKILAGASGLSSEESSSETGAAAPAAAASSLPPGIP